MHIMTDQELFEKIKQIVEQEVIVNWDSEVTNAATVSQLILMLLQEAGMGALTMRETFDSIVTQVKLGGTVTHKLTVSMLQNEPIERLHAEGFRNWDDTMILLPAWALAVMQTGERLMCIDGKHVTVGVDRIDEDTRGGCIAYGVPHTDIPRKETR
jgi:hypothetical protein